MEVSSSMERMSSHLKYSRYLIQQWWWECTYTSGHTPRYRMSSHLESTWGTRFKQTIMRVYVHRWSHTEVNTERHHNLTQVFWFPTCFMRTCVRGAMRMYGWQHTVLHKWIKETTQIWQGPKNKGVRIQGNQGTGVWWHANWKCERHVYTGPRGKTRKPSKHTVVTRHKCVFYNLPHLRRESKTIRLLKRKGWVSKYRLITRNVLSLPNLVCVYIKNVCKRSV
jgi:hypothetical protein